MRATSPQSRNRIAGLSRRALLAGGGLGGVSLWSGPFGSPQLLAEAATHAPTAFAGPPDAALLEQRYPQMFRGMEPAGTPDAPKTDAQPGFFVSADGLPRMVAGTPCSPMSWSNPARRAVVTSSGGRPRAAVAAAVSSATPRE